MTALHAVLLGIVEGITEFLPISSTAHLVLAAKALGLQQTEFAKTFEIAIQSGSIAAVIVLYAKRLCTDMHTNVRIAAAFVPTAIIGLLAHKLVKDVFLESQTIIVAALAIGGGVLIIFELIWKQKTEATVDVRHIRISQAILIGICQGAAIVPGVSRAAATVIGGMALGLPRRTIVEFSFLLAVPTILAATALDIVKTGTAFTPTEWQLLLIGSLTSFVVALIVIRWLLQFVTRHSFVVFGIERILIAATAFFLLQ